MIIKNIKTDSVVSPLANGLLASNPRFWVPSYPSLQLWLNLLTASSEHCDIAA